MPGLAVPLRIDALHLEGGVVIVVSGDLDAASVPALRPVIESIVTATGRLTLDLSSVTFIDASGLGLLAAAARRCKEMHDEVVILEPSSCVARLLVLSRIDRVVRVTHSRSLSSL
ncbi:MAG: anti-sigma factor antagonist [Ilumatobacteraceae bacterium]|nr:anti-sigma factor antagonist [Ilumatobacteraceae bacterium]